MDRGDSEWSWVLGEGSFVPEGKKFPGSLSNSTVEESRETRLMGPEFGG